MGVEGGMCCCSVQHDAGFKVMILRLGCLTVYILAGPNLIKLQVYYHDLNPQWKGKHMVSLWILWLIQNESFLLNVYIEMFLTRKFWLIGTLIHLELFS